ncbi:MAG TPA: N-acetyltransferase [Bacteroidetes bacterium]|nr:N-acetyltransferase [Bacteroidota bacterium]HIL57394.1 N-acetyltransferase [Rhodothermales bacterium]
MTVQHDPDQRRFTADTEHGTAELAYTRSGDRITFVHTEVPKADEGQGVGSALAEAGLNFARENGLAVIPQCPFVAQYVRDHPDTHDLLASDASV